jgi:hypothetical protein
MGTITLLLLLNVLLIGFGLDYANRCQGSVKQNIVNNVTMVAIRPSALTVPGNMIEIDTSRSFSSMGLRE